MPIEPTDRRFHVGDEVYTTALWVERHVIVHTPVLDWSALPDGLRYLLSTQDDGEVHESYVPAEQVHATLDEATRAAMELTAEEFERTHDALEAIRELTRKLCREPSTLVRVVEPADGCSP